MNVEELREYCLSLKSAQENMPWAEPKYSMLVTFTVAGKWFCLLNLDNNFINVKCDPATVVEMQSRYQGATSAFHMNKKHWLGIQLESDIPDSVIKDLLADGYRLIVSKLPKSIKESL